MYRIHKWWTFGRRQKSEMKLIKNIKEKFGEDCILAYGDWSSSTQFKGTISSPTVGVRKLLSKHFTVIDIPEYKTTKTCCRCHQPTLGPHIWKTKTELRRKKKPDKLDEKMEIKEKMEIEEKKEGSYPVRGIRRCQNEECGVIFNRDYNAAINIRLNLLHYIQHGDWCDRFKRKNTEFGAEIDSNRFTSSRLL